MRTDPAARAWLLAGLAGLLLTVGAGVAAAVALTFGYRLSPGDFHQFGRLRPVHTRLAIHAAFVPLVLGVLRARLPAPATALERAAPAAWLALQVLACLGVLALGAAGPAYLEVFPAVDLAGLAVLVPTGLALARGLRGGAAGEPATRLHAAEFLAWGLVLTLAGRLVLPALSGARAAAAHRAWLADGLGLVLLAGAAAAAYASLPAAAGGASRRPRLARLGFVLLLPAFVLASGRHALHGPVSAPVQWLGAASGVLGAAAAGILAWNVGETVLRGRAATPAHRSGAAWLLAGAVLLVLAAVQGAFQGLPALNAALGRTDWVAGHAHLAFAGAVFALLLGAVQSVAADLPRAPARTSGLLRAAWVAAFLGMAAALGARGLVEARQDLLTVPFAARFSEIQGHWHVRLALGVLPVLPLLLWTAAAARALLGAPATDASDRSPATRSPLPARGVLAAVGAALSLGFAAAAAPAASEAARRTEAHPGAAVYLREGCAACHTLAPRNLPTDLTLHGPPASAADSLPWPGTRRIGPDLLHVGSRRSPVWLRAHLAAPTRTDHASGHVGVTRTAMPSFAHLDPRDLDALVDWLASLR